MTLRSRLVVALLAIAIAIVATGGIVVSSHRQFLLDQLDRRLATSSPPSARMVQLPPAAAGEQLLTPRPDLPSELVELYVAQVDAAGQEQRVLLPGEVGKGSPSLVGRDLTRLAAEQKPVSVGASGNTGSYRVRVVASPTGFVVVAMPLDRLDASVTRLMVVMAVAAGVVLGLLGLLGWWVVRLGLRPIGEMTRTADAIAGGDLTRRVDQLPVTTEAGRLARAFNVMLDERQGSEERLRRFVADASHELRTPLTSIQGYISLYRRGGLDGPADLDDAMRRVGQEAGRMGELVEDLLLLARLDAGRPLANDPIDLTQLLQDVASDATAVHHGRPLHVDVDDGLELRGDEPRLRQVFGALVTNAFVHNEADVPVVLRGRQCDGNCAVEVVDEGSGMPPELAGRVFQRFVRGDPGRSRHQGGSGLGLAIVRSVVESHGGVVSLVTAEARGTTVRVVLRAAGSREVPSERRVNS